jgi:hypothetical protein
VLILVAICSLTFNLATRFLAPAASQSHAAKSVDRRSAEPVRQHLDRDATQWVAPSANFSIIDPTTIETHLAPARPLLPKLVFSNSLYNRPPPAFISSL